ncbi:MAG TPA: PAS domain S-box protein [Polyangiaceae bacterium]|nr:PAS domain S-box protein [Polyangiaceae bacterium]
MLEERYNALVAEVDGIVWEADAETLQFTFVSRKAEHLGYPLEHWLAPGFWAARIHPNDRADVVERCRRAASTQTECDLEYRMISAAGGSVWLRGKVNSQPLPGGPPQLRGIMRDVSEQKRKEAQLLELQERFRLLAESSLTGIYLIQDELFRYVNPAMASMFGYDVEEIIDKLGPTDLTSADDRAKVAENVRRRIAGEVEEVRYEIRGTRKDGTTIYVEVHGRRIERGGKTGVIGTLVDITERKRTERALAESYGLLNGVVEGTSDAVFVKDLQGRYLLINSAGAQLLGKNVEEVLGKDDAALFSADTASVVKEGDRQVLESGQSHTFEETATAAGVTRTFLSTKGVLRDAQGDARGVIGIARDITDLKRLEEQFRQAQKMEAIGRLAGGVAHDFNNLLTAINGYSELALAEVGGEHRTAALLTEIRKAGDRAAGLTRQLLAFSRKQVLKPQIVNLNTLLAELCKLLRTIIGEDIELCFAPGPQLGFARIDPGHFEHAVINLAVNARDAMPHGGRLVIETDEVELDDDDTARREVRAGRYLLVAVSDSGHGMDTTTRSRIFEPFFTTKPAGKGTGLGLAMVYGFLKQSGGHVEVYSEPGHGTTFKIYLPLADAASPSERRVAEPLHLPRGTETVLLVEDEAAVRNLARLVLSSGGYTVLEARDGEEALRLAADYPNTIHLLVTDLIMPRLAGRQLAAMLAETRPGVKTLLMSGYTDQAIAAQGSGLAPVAFLQKPFSPTALARKVREILDEA